MRPPEHGSVLTRIMRELAGPGPDWGPRVGWMGKEGREEEHS